MGDVDDADARLLQVGDDFEERLGLGHGECGGWLIEYENTRAVRQCARQLNNLPSAKRELRSRSGDRNASMQLRQRRSGSTIFTGAIDYGDDLYYLPAGKDVFGDVEVGHYRKFLMNDADAMSGGIARGIEVNHVAIQCDGSFVGALDSGQYSHQRRLAGTVFADQNVDRAAMQFEVDVVESDIAGITFKNAARLEDDVAHAGAPCNLARETARCHLE